MLTPSDIERKTFSTALRGYDLDEVDDFLDEVMATLRDLQEELAEARSSAARSPDPAADESAVGRALIAAQSAADQILETAREEAERTRATANEEAERNRATANEEAERTRANATEEADRVLTEVREQADEIVAQRDSKKAEAEAEMRVLAEHVSNIRTQLALLATAVADKLDEMDALIAGEAAAESGQASGTGGWDEEAEPTVSGEMAEVGQEGGSAEGSLFDEEEGEEDHESDEGEEGDDHGEEDDEEGADHSDEHEEEGEEDDESLP